MVAKRVGEAPYQDGCAADVSFRNVEKPDHEHVVIHGVAEKRNPGGPEQLLARLRLSSLDRERVGRLSLALTLWRSLSGAHIHALSRRPLSALRSTRPVTPAPKSRILLHLVTRLAFGFSP